MTTVSTLHYEGTYEGKPVSGQVPVWSIPNSPEDAARLLYVVIAGRTLRARPGFEWSCGDSDFVAWRTAGKTTRPTHFLRFTFRLERAAPPSPLYVDGKSPAIRAFEHLDRLAEKPITLRRDPSVIIPVADPVALPSECDEIAASMSDKAPHFTTFDEASQWVRARMPGESCTVIDNTAESLMRRPTPAPTFADDIPEPAFDILSDESGNGARAVVIYRRPGSDIIEFSAGPCALARLAPAKIPGLIVAWQCFRTDDGWSWYRSGGWAKSDSSPLFLDAS